MSDVQGKTPQYCLVESGTVNQLNRQTAQLVALLMMLREEAEQYGDDGNGIMGNGLWLASDLAESIDSLGGLTMPLGAEFNSGKITELNSAPDDLDAERMKQVKS